jgi:hypothetical protein
MQLSTRYEARFPLKEENVAHHFRFAEDHKIKCDLVINISIRELQWREDVCQNSTIYVFILISVHFLM